MASHFPLSKAESIDTALLKIRHHLDVSFTKRNYQGTPGLDARLIVAYALNLTQDKLILHHDHSLTAQDINRISHLVLRRTEGEPIARIIGYSEFWGLPFELNAHTLIPRPESEFLVSTALEVIANRFYDPQQSFKLLDIGTGCGCLALAIMHECAHVMATGTDIAPAALDMANHNAKKLGFSERFTTRFGHNMAALNQKETEKYPGPFDIIISNPPYVPTSDIQHLSAEVKNFDPYLALDGGINGLDFYQTLIPESFAHLTEHGTLILEFGVGQATKICQMMVDHCFHVVKIVPDLANYPRIVVAEKQTFK